MQKLSVAFQTGARVVQRGREGGGPGRAALLGGTGKHRLASLDSGQILFIILSHSTPTSFSRRGASKAAIL